MVTAVGDDIFGEGAIRNLERVGIDTTYVRRVPMRSSTHAAAAAALTSEARMLN
jgi:sugar/nucleoside kinase (ribokinase family)